MKASIAISVGVILAVLHSWGIVPGSLESGLVPEWIERLGWTLVHSAWQLTAVAAIAALVEFSLKHSRANARYVAGVTALVLMLDAATAPLERLTVMVRLTRDCTGRDAKIATAAAELKTLCLFRETKNQRGHTRCIATSALATLKLRVAKRQVWHALRYEGRGVVRSSATPIAYGSERATPILSIDEALVGRELETFAARSSVVCRGLTTTK